MKILLKISFGLLILILIAVAGFALTFNPNDYKRDIVALVKENTGRQLNISGDISLSFFPWIGLELGKIEISNAKGFSKKPFAKMTHLQVRAKLWPLLQQRLEADTLVIEGLTLNIAKNKLGKGNWEDLLQNTKGKKTTSPSTKTLKDKKTQTNLLAVFAINGIKISQSQFHFNDKQLNQYTSIKDVQLDMGQLKPNTAIPFSSRFEFQQTGLYAKIDFTNSIKLSSDFKEISLNNVILKVDTKLASLKKTQAINLNSEAITLNLDKQTARSKKINLAINDAKLNMSFIAKNIFSNPTVSSQLNIETLNPRTTMNDFGVILPNMSDKNALTKLNAKFKILASTKKVSLSDLAIELDDTQIKGSASIKLPSSSSLNLNINAINLDRYLPPLSATNSKKANPTKQTKVLEAALIPVALLTQIDMNANVKINKLQAKNTHWKNLKFVAKANKGNVNINPIKLQGYGSTINSSLAIKTTKQSASLSAKLNVKNIKSGEILKDFMGVKNLQGLTSVKANISTKGVKLTQLKQNLKGNIQFNLKDGIIKGFDLEYEINKLNAKIKQQPAPATPSPLQTKLTNLSASALIKKGILYNKDLRAATPFTRIIGQGNVNLPKEQLNYVATVKLTNSRDIKSNKSFEKMNSIPLDVHIRGTFDKPKIKADFSKALKNLAKKKLKAKVKSKQQQIKEKAKNELKKKLGDKLKNLFKF